MRKAINVAVGLVSAAVVLWELPAIGRFVLKALGILTTFDFFYERNRDPTWVGKVADMAINPPPGTALLVALVGLVLIYWSTKPREIRMSWPILGMLLSFVALATFGVLYLARQQKSDVASAGQTVETPSSPQTAALQSQIQELQTNLTSARSAYAKAQQEADQLRAERTGGAHPYALPIMWSLPPLAKELSPYEVGQKLPAIDAFLKFLSEDMQPTIDEGRLLRKIWSDSIRDPGKYPDFHNRLMSYFQKMKSDIDKIEISRANYPQYQDIVATMAPSYWNIVLPRTEKFIVACQFASANPNKGAVDFFMEDFSKDFTHAAQIFEEWRNRTRSRLLEIRKQISQ
jgi:hypothetical protein